MGWHRGLMSLRVLANLWSVPQGSRARSASQSYEHPPSEELVSAP